MGAHMKAPIFGPYWPHVQAEPWQEQWETGGSWQQEANLPPAGSWQQQADLGDPWQQALWPSEGPWHPGYQPPVQAGYPSVGSQPGYPAGYPVVEQGSFPAGEQVDWQGRPPCSPEPPVFPAVYRYLSHLQPLSCTLVPVATTVRGCTSSHCHAGSSTTPVTRTTAAILSILSQSHHQQGRLCQPFQQPTQDQSHLIPQPQQPPMHLPPISAQGRSR